MTPETKREDLFEEKQKAGVAATTTQLKETLMKTRQGTEAQCQTAGDETWTLNRLELMNRSEAGGLMATGSRWRWAGLDREAETNRRKV